MTGLVEPLLRGLLVTLELTAGAAMVGIVAAFAAGLGKLSPIAPIRWLSVAYIEVFRGTSALVQLFWFYFVLPFFGIELSALTAGIVVLGLNAGSYGAEIVRGAIQAVPHGQHEAAVALNFTPLQALWRITVPQAVVAMLPPGGNIVIELLKNTALVSLITLSELTFTAQLLRAETLETGKLFGTILLIYFAVAQAIAYGVRKLEDRVGHGMPTGGVR